MLFSSLLLLALSSLSVLKCASFEEDESIIVDTEDVEMDSDIIEVIDDSEVTVTQERSNKFSCSYQNDWLTCCLNDELLQNILEYVAESPGKMAMTSYAMRASVERTKPLRFYEGDRWSMPELLNVLKSGMPTNEAIKFELNRIIELKHGADENRFNRSMNKLLVKDEIFKVLAGSVLKYLVRIVYAVIARTDLDFANRKNLIYYAVNHEMYDVFFEMNKDRYLMGIAEYVISYSFYYDFFNWVYDNSFARRFFLKKVAVIVHRHGIPNMNRSEIQAWTAVCLQKKAPESFYIGYLNSDPIRFHEAVHAFLFKFSFITLDDGEMAYYHAFIKGLIEINVSLFPDAGILPFSELLNDVRYGPEDAGIYHNRILPINTTSEHRITMLIMAASKANKKGLVRELSSHPRFSAWDLEETVEHNKPNGFKVFFDIMEECPIQSINSGLFRYTRRKLISIITVNNFKFTSAISLPIGVRFVIESAPEYLDLGFAPKYDFIFGNDSTRNWFLSMIRTKMFNDAAEAGAEEFRRFINKFCGDQPGNSNFIQGSEISVLYKVIRLLLDNEPLIQLLRNNNVKVYCNDGRISDELIANYRGVINPAQ